MESHHVVFALIGGLSHVCVVDAVLSNMVIVSSSTTRREPMESLREEDLRVLRLPLH